MVYENPAKKKKKNSLPIIIGLVLLLIFGTTIGVAIYQNRAQPTKSQPAPPRPETPVPVPLPIPVPPNNSQFEAMVASGQEPEYQENPFLPISSLGTDYTTVDETNLPAGSALLTDTLDGSGGGTSQLHNQGITHIIHAAPKPRSSFSTDQDFINCVVKSIQNSIILADREDIQKQIETDNGIAICLVGGGTYLGSCDPAKLAEGIIRGGLNQLAKCQKLREIRLLDWEGNSSHHFLQKIRQLEKELLIDATFFEEDNHFVGNLKSDKLKGISVRVGDIRNKQLHKASVIVNAANTYVGFGGGISGAIAEQVGDKTGIETKAKQLISKFKSKLQPPNNPDDDQADLISSMFKWDGCIKQGYWLFKGPKSKQLKVNIAMSHPFLRGKKLDNSDETPLFSIQFNKKNASKQEGDKTWYFEENNSNFELTPFGDWPNDNPPPPPPNQNNKEEMKVRFNKKIFGDAAFDNLLGLGMPTQIRYFRINFNHPLIQKLAGENKLVENRKFIISYGKEDKNFAGVLYFDQDNSELEISET